MEEKRSARRVDRQLVEIVQDDQVDFRQHFGKLPCLAECFLLLQHIDQFHGQEEADFASVLRDDLNADCGSRVAFTRSSPADQHDILSGFDELIVMRLPHRCFVNLVGGKAEAGEVIVCRDARHLGAVGDGPYLAICDLRREQLWRRSFERRRALADQVLNRICHAKRA